MASAFVDSEISEHGIVVFSKSYCPYCKKAKAILKADASGKDLAIYELDERDDGSEIQDYLAKKTGQRTVPNIFIGGQHIGGSSDLIDIQKSGKLAQLLSEI